MFRPGNFLRDRRLISQGAERSFTHCLHIVYTSFERRRRAACVERTLQGGEPLVGEVVVGLQSFDASLENLLLLLHLLDPQFQLPLLGRSPLRQLLLPALCRLQRGSREHAQSYSGMDIKPAACSQTSRRPGRYLNLVGELFDLVDGGVVLVGELPQLLLAPLGHLLQVGALVFCVTE